MEHRIEVRQMFDETFKRKVIEEYLRGGINQAELRRKYNIRFGGAIRAWMSKLGYSREATAAKPNFDRIILPDLSKKQSLQSAEELQQKIKELEQQLQDEKLRSEAYARIIEKAEKELKIPIRKKPNTR